MQTQVPKKTVAPQSAPVQRKALTSIAMEPVQRLPDLEEEDYSTPLEMTSVGNDNLLQGKGDVGQRKEVGPLQPVQLVLEHQKVIQRKLIHWSNPVLVKNKIEPPEQGAEQVRIAAHKV